MFDKLIDLFVSFIHIFQFFFITHSYQKGVVLRWGKFNRLIDPGFHWIWPFCIEAYMGANVVPETMIVGPQSLTTKCGKSIVVSNVVTYSIEDIQKFLLEIEGGHQVIEDSTYGIVSAFIMEHSWDELMTVDISNELTKDVRRLAKRYGVQIINVQLRDFTSSKSFRLMQEFLHNGSHV